MAKKTEFKRYFLVSYNYTYKGGFGFGNCTYETSGEYPNRVSFKKEKEEYINKQYDVKSNVAILAIIEMTEKDYKEYSKP